LMSSMKEKNVEKALGGLLEVLMGEVGKRAEM
jgi:uncharacterized protein YjgD (DUF1641 family)